MKILIVVLLLLHVLGDFFFQSENMAARKKSEKKYLIKHFVVIFSINGIAYIISNFQKELLYMLIISFTSHVLIDTVKFCSEQTGKEDTNRIKIIYIIDQIAHLITLLIVAYIYKDKVVIENFLLNDIMNYKETLPILLAFLIIGKPANVTFRILFKDKKPESANEKQSDNIKEEEKYKLTNENNNFESYYEEVKVGKIIGTLERSIVLMLYLLNSISSVGLIIAAKTLTRYKKINEDENFAEYYLLGTLYSIAVTFLTILLFIR